MKEISVSLILQKSKGSERARIANVFVRLRIFALGGKYVVYIYNKIRCINPKHLRLAWGTLKQNRNLQMYTVYI